MVRIIYNKRYNIGFYGLERLHPFDSRKYGRAWKLLKRRFGSELTEFSTSPHRQATSDDLCLVHSESYLAKLRDSQYVARALELPPLRLLPSRWIDWHVLRPMRWATMGTVLAATEALTSGLAVNLSGGYHHAKPNRGEGFSIFADAAIAVATLRQQNLIARDSRIVHIDTDAHQGNGVCHCSMTDRRVYIFDIFNSQIYPAYDSDAKERIDCPVSVTPGITDSEYLAELESRLPGFLDSVGKSPIGLAIYNAGTDVFAGDPLGGMQISDKAILQRDLFVINQLRQREIPTVMLLSGGYTRQSYQLVANSVIALMEKEISVM